MINSIQITKLKFTYTSVSHNDPDHNVIQELKHVTNVRAVDVLGHLEYTSRAEMLYS